MKQEVDYKHTMSRYI